MSLWSRIFLVLLFLAGTASAATVEYPKMPKNLCTDHVAASCSTGEPCETTGADIGHVINSGSQAMVTIRENASSLRVGAMSCEIRWNFSGFSASDYTQLLDYGSGSVLYLTDTVPSLIFTGNLPYWWIYCATSTAGAASFDMRTCAAVR